MKSALLSLVLFAAVASNTAFAGWGAIAYNSYTGTTSQAHGYDTYSEAVNSALAYCGGGCAVINWENNSCIALATGNGRWGEGHGFGDANSAINEAVNVCGWGCAWREWACD